MVNYFYIVSAIGLGYFFHLQFTSNSSLLSRLLWWLQYYQTLALAFPFWAETDLDSKGRHKKLFFLLLVKKLRLRPPPPPFLTTSVFSDKDFLDQARPPSLMKGLENL